MNSEQVFSALRMILQWLGVFAASKGWADDSTAQAIGGAVLTLAVAGWGLYTRRNTGLVASAAAVPDVQRIVTTTTKLADAVPSSKVQAR